MMMMRIIYIAGKFRGSNAWELENNVRRAEEVAYAVAHLGAMPLATHSLGRYFDGTLTDQFWLDGTLELMKRCDALMMVPGWKASQGANKERELALKTGLPVFESIDSLRMWLSVFEEGEMGPPIFKPNPDGTDTFVLTRAVIIRDATGKSMIHSWQDEPGFYRYALPGEASDASIMSPDDFQHRPLKKLEEESE